MIRNDCNRTHILLHFVVVHKPLLFIHSIYLFADFRSTIVHANMVPPKDHNNVSSLRERQAEDIYNKNPRETEAMPANLSRTIPVPQRFLSSG